MVDSATSLHVLADPLVARPIARSLHLRCAGLAIAVSSDSHAVMDALEHYYREFTDSQPPEPQVRVVVLEAPAPDMDLPFAAYPPGPGKTVIKDEYVDFPDGRVLRKRLTGVHFLFGPDVNVAIGPCMDNLNQVINFINNRYTQWHLDRGWLLCHCAAVARGDRGIAIAGLPGRGKSTLALELLERGVNFVSNDRLMIRREGGELSMLGVPKFPRVNPGTILSSDRLARLLSPEERRRFEGLSRHRLWHTEHKFDVDIAEFFGPDRMQLVAPLAAIVVLSWTPGDRASDASGADPREADLRRRPDLLTALIKSPGVHYYAPPSAPPDLSNSVYVDCIGDCPVVEMAGRPDFHAATSVCLSLLDA